MVQILTKKLLLCTIHFALLHHHVVVICFFRKLPPIQSAMQFLLEIMVTQRLGNLSDRLRVSHNQTHAQDIRSTSLYMTHLVLDLHH